MGKQMALETATTILHTLWVQRYSGLLVQGLWAVCLQSFRAWGFSRADIGSEYAG